VETVSDSDSLSDVAATSLADGSVVSWLTYFDPAQPLTRLKTPAPDGRFDPLSAELAVRAVTGSVADAPRAETISLRARSLGGALLVPDPKVGDALLAWTALDAGKPQVFVTLVGRDGKKIRQRMLTRTPGEKSDVAGVFAADGWLLAWVDERNQGQEVVLTKINRALTTVVPERVVTQAPSAASAPSLLEQGGHVWMTWADARDAAKPGWASVQLLQVAAVDGAVAGKPVALLTSDLHEFAPVLAPFGDAMAIAWLESDPKVVAPTGGIRIGRLDATGHFVEPPIFVEGKPRTFTSLALSCDPTRCHVVASAGAGERAELVAFDFTPGHSTRPSRLIGLGPALTAAYPAFAGDDLFYGDLSLDGRGRVRRMRIDWSGK
jgi:hypothetical protein